MSAIRVFDMEEANLSLLNSLEQLSKPGVSMSVCLSAALLWIRETMVQGDMQNDTVLRNNRQVITMRQASFQIDSRINHCDFLDLDREVIEKLLTSYHLRTVNEGHGDLLDFVDTAVQMQAIPGYYLVYFKNPAGDRGHTLGFKFMTDGRSFLFDPADGLYQFRDTPALWLTLLALNAFQYEAYLGGQYWFRQLSLG